MVLPDRPVMLPTLTQRLIGEVTKVTAEMPNDRRLLEWFAAQKHAA